MKQFSTCCTLIVFLALALFPGSLQAQTGDALALEDHMRQVKRKVNEKRNSAFATIMQMTDEQSKAFRPLQKAYANEYKQLEKKGMLRHIRVSNEGDIVAVSPSAGFYQTGLNLHVAPGKQVEIGYCKDRSIWSQLNVSALANHGLPT